MFPKSTESNENLIVNWNTANKKKLYFLSLSFRKEVTQKLQFLNP